MKHFFHRDIFFSTIFVFLVFILFKLVISFNLHLFDPLKESLSDFDATDLLFSRFHDQKNIPVDTNIFLVNIGTNNRQQIANQIRIIRNHSPKVIGLDITFPFLKDSIQDSILAAELKNTTSLVSIMKFDYKSGDNRDADTIISSHPKFGLKESGFINFVSREHASTIRLFSPSFQYSGNTYLSFSSLIVKKDNEAVFSNLMRRDYPAEIIHYKGNIYGDSAKFISIEATDVSDSSQLLDQLRGKIVLLGYMGPDLSTPVIEDNHFTPLNESYSGRTNPDMYGVVIHANIIAMILDGNFISRMNIFLLYFLSFIICYIHMYFFIPYFVKRHIWFHIFAKIIQLFTSILIVFLALCSFKYLKYKIDTTTIILPIVISVDLLYFYDWIVKSLNNSRYQYKTYFTEGHDKKKMR